MKRMSNEVTKDDSLDHFDSCLTCAVMKCIIKSANSLYVLLKVKET